MIRFDKVHKARAAIAAGRYLTPEREAVAVDAAVEEADAAWMVTRGDSGGLPGFGRLAVAGAPLDASHPGQNGASAMRGDA